MLNFFNFYKQNWTPYALSVTLTFPKSMYLGNFCGFLGTLKST